MIAREAFQRAQQVIYTAKIYLLQANLSEKKKGVILHVEIVRRDAIIYIAPREPLALI